MSGIQNTSNKQRVKMRYYTISMLHKFGGIVEDGQMAGYEREFQILQEFLSGNWFLFYLLRREQKTW